MGQVEMMKQALKELREEATATDLAAFIEGRYGVRIDPKFVPVLRASVRGQELLEQFRRKAREINGGSGTPPQAA